MKTRGGMWWALAVVFIVAGIGAGCSDIRDGARGLAERIRPKESSTSESAGGEDLGRRAGKIVWTEGAATLDGVPAEIGDPVREGSLLATGADGAIEATFGNRKILRIGPDSALTLRLATQTMDLGSGSLGVVQSKTRSLVKGNPWRVITPTVVGGVRGTTYYINVESSDQVYFCVCNGDLRLQEAEGELFRDVAAGHHHATRFRRMDDGSTAVIEAPMLYHMDDDMDDLADRINVPIVWGEIPEY